MPAVSKQEKNSLILTSRSVSDQRGEGFDLISSDRIVYAYFIRQQLDKTTSNAELPAFTGEIR